MKKRLTSLFLCLLMVLSVFLAGCAEETEEDVQNKIEEMAAKNTVSLTMWIVSEEKVSDTVAAAVTKELSTLTEAKYKARLEIKYFTEEEYYESLTGSVSAYLKDAKNKVQDTTEEETQELPQTEEGADGLLRDKYPDFEKNQVDIIYIGDVKGKSGEAFFNEFVSKGYLAKLDECIATNAKTLREYLSPTLLSAVQKNGVTYAIPNNNVIGEYTYMLMNKELMDVIFSGYVLDGSIDALYNEHVYGFLDQIKTMTDSSVLPIDATYEECLELLAHYWSIDSKTYDINGTDFSVFGSLYEDLSKLSRGSVSLDVESLFANPEFVKSYLKLNSYRLDENGRDFFRSEKNANTVYEKTAIKFLKDDLTVLTEVIDENTKESVYYYDDADGTRYYAVPVKYPSATTDDIYSNMFGVFASSKDVARCMDIITYINTNVTARNILQYGVLDEHYSLKEREVEGLAENERSYYVESKSDGGKLLYNMDIYATGNAFLAYMPAEMNELRMLGTFHFPGIAVLEPAVRLFDLTAVDDLLTENPVIVPEPVSHARKFKRGHGIEITRGKPPEAAVAEPGVGFIIAQIVPVDAVFAERVAAELVGLEVDHVVGEKPAHKELKRQIIDPLRILFKILFLRAYPALDDTVAYRIGESGVLVARSRTILPLGERISQMP